MDNQCIVILDFGSQYTQLIARRVREMGVYSVVLPCDVCPETIATHQPKGIILSGGPETTTHGASPKAPEVVFQMGCPVLGICYGMQTMAKQLGGHVRVATHKEFGQASIQCTRQGGLWGDLYDWKQLDVWMSHGDQVVDLPPGFVCTAKTNNTPIAAMAHESQGFYGVQFHPEVTHTPQGFQMLQQFVYAICGCQKLWTMDHIRDHALSTIKSQVGEEHVLLALSGGVDSAVTAALLHQALGAQLTCVFVDTGLLRAGEGDEVMQIFHEHLGVHVLRVEAADQFFSALAGVQDPEEKRKIIGREFVSIFESVAQEHKQMRWLAQGTIYPDVIESTGSKSHVIKSHHNVGGLPDTLQLKLLEPLRQLFKDEVRQLGLQLGLPEKIIYRHPFPGPGLAVRVLGAVAPYAVAVLQKADAIFIESLRAHDLYDKVSQAFAVFLPIKSVGVVGDARQYDYVIALRAVETVDFMTAQWARLPQAFLAHVSHRIINEVPGVSRVVYDISGKPPATIEWE